MVKNSKLVTGGDNPFLPYLCKSISQASEIDFTVAFTMATGLRLLLPDMHDTLDPAPESGRTPAKLR